MRTSLARWPKCASVQKNMPLNSTIFQFFAGTKYFNCVQPDHSQACVQGGFPGQSA
jgi:hypothetical protein